MKVSRTVKALKAFWHWLRCEDEFGNPIDKPWQPFRYSEKNRTLETKTVKWDDDVEDLIESQLLNVIRLFRLEKNEEATWQKLYDIVNAIMSPVRDEGYVADFKIVCDGRVNDKEAIDENELHMQIGIKIEAGARFCPYHFCIILDDTGTAMLVPPDTINLEYDFVNVE